jgi:tungstate transport system substrate-binding protein
MGVKGHSDVSSPELSMMSFQRSVWSLRNGALSICVGVILGTACSERALESRTVDMATTTSVVNSGLLGTLLPLFEKNAGITVRVHAAGSGRALEMLNDQVVDLVISHAPKAEERMLATHPEWRYQKIATNQFLLVGPRSDPAGVKNAADAPSAFERIATARQFFLSRGDGSGTHERETELWSLAKAKPDPIHLLVSGSGMGATLRQADERGAYTLSDDATFIQLRDRLALEVLFANDPRLLNSYAVVLQPKSPAAARFAAWLISGNGRDAIANYRIGATQPFRVWPDGCPGDHPSSILC